jgi:uncharacterized membrane protein YqiK
MTVNLHRVLVIIVVICIVVIFLIIFAVQSSSSPAHALRRSVSISTKRASGAV